MAVDRFEDLVAWQRASDLAVSVHRLVKSEAFADERILADQVWRCAVSVPSNIAEGFEKYTRTEFARYLGIAKGSCGELRSQLHLCLRIGLKCRSELLDLLRESTEVGKIIGGLRASLNRKRDDRD
jgi:four helix bundle protein